MTRPPRTAGHAQLQTLVQQFADAGLTPVISTNGSIPGADIQIAKGPKPGEVVEARLTEKGEDRLAAMWVVRDVASEWSKSIKSSTRTFEIEKRER